MQRYLIALLFLMFFSSFLYGQSGKAKVTGIITDASSGQPVELVTVYIKGTSKVSESAENGRYSIEVPANESFELVFSRIGYIEVSSIIEPIPSQRYRQVDVILALSD